MGVPANGILADVGCGNGKYFGVRKDMTILASDRSFGLIDQAQQRCYSPLSYSSSELRAPSAFNKDIGAASSKEKEASETSEGVREVSSAVDRTTDAINGNQHGRREQLIASHADVLVADGLKLPYKVSRNLW